MERKAKSMFGGKRNHFNSYNAWTITDEREYIGLAETDKEWLRKFNKEYTNEHVSEEPIITNPDMKREIYRAAYKRERDAMQVANFDKLQFLSYDSVGELEALIDAYSRKQKLLRASKPKSKFTKN